jgi:hypothetical protein
VHIRDIRVPANSYKFGGNALGRKDEIHATGRDGGLRHGGEFRGGRVLRERHATRGFDGVHARRTIRPGAGQDDPDCPASALASQRSKEPVNGHV